ncbi:MAG: DUF2780 domain-containing protein [Pseudomonadales bacterium]|nr:DUF2780 domain-containing protein [Pseudomonadales bacterium]
MMNKLFNVILLMSVVSFSTSAYAGWWDELFATSEPAPQKAAQAVEVATPDLKSVAAEIAKDAATQSIVDLVSAKAGVTADQASGGLGAIFKTAQGSLSKEDFGSIAQAIPEMEGLLAAAPMKQENGGLVSGLLAGAGKAGELIGLFDQLGLSPAQVSTFMTIIQQYFSSEEKPELSELLMQGVASFL